MIELKTLGRHIATSAGALVLLPALPMFFTHELAHAIPAVARREDGLRATVHLGRSVPALRWSVGQIDFVWGPPTDGGWAPCCWWDWRHASETRKQLSLIGGPISDTAWLVGAVVAAMLTEHVARAAALFVAAYAFGLLIANVMPVAVRGARSDGWYFTHLDEVPEHPPCRDAHGRRARAR